MVMVSQRSKVANINGNGCNASSISSISGSSNNTTSLSNNIRYQPVPLSAPSVLPPMMPSPSVVAHAQFNPRLIISQIVALQSFHYVVLGIIFQVNHVIFATSITLDRIFTSKYLDIWSAQGWTDNAAVLISSIIG